VLLSTRAGCESDAGHLERRRAMNCPACGAADLRVLKTMPTPSAVHRIRECQRCRARWNTTERLVPGTLVGGTPKMSAKLRFSVLRRDGFTCQYCGKSAPNVLLEVDHIKPRSAGGGNEDTNLVTSCRDCNRGKGASL